MAMAQEMYKAVYEYTASEADELSLHEGDLVARERLIVRSGGRIHGKVRYGRIVIESGGEIAGDMQTLSSSEGDE